MKKFVAISLIIFTMFISYVAIGGFLQKQQKGSTVPETTTSSATAPTPSTSSKTFTVAEVATHNSTSDCWLIINNTVYDVSKFLGDHPGGASIIIPYCGKEATKAFDTQDRGSRGGHSSSASSMLNGYQIGTLK